LGKLTKKDHRLLRRIAREVRSHPEKYRSAGKWLDEHCSKEAWLKREESRLEDVEEELRKFRKLPQEQYANPTAIREENRNAIREIIKRGEVSQRRLLSDAVECLEKKYGGAALATSPEDGRRVLLISWLMYDPDTEAVGGTITKFALWAWKSQDDDDYIGSREDAANSFWLRPGSERWKELARWAMGYEEATDENDKPPIAPLLLPIPIGVGKRALREKEVGEEEVAKTKPIKKPSQAEKRAWDSYEWLVTELKTKPDLLPREEDRWYSRAMYDHLKENGPFYANHPSKPTELPVFGSWTRYLRRYEEWRRSQNDDRPTISDQPESSVRCKDLPDEDLRRLSSRFEQDNPG